MRLPLRMHDKAAEGNDFFRCDFCHCGWSEERPMVEGHKGSLICAECLALAYAEVVRLDAGIPHDSVDNCTLCLSHKEEPHWRSPMHGEAVACRWCIEHAAKALEKDPGARWERPGGGAAAR